MNLKTSIFAAVSVLALSVVMSSDARADGVLIRASAMTATDRQSLELAVSNAKKASSTAFDSVRDIHSQLATLDAQKRGRYAIISPALKALKRDGLLPMLEEIALEGHPRGNLNDTAWKAWRLSLLDAVGTLRDNQAAPALAAVLDSGETDGEILRAAAEAYGKLGTDAVVAKLTTLLASSTPSMRKAAILGLGMTRRTVATKSLQNALSKLPASDEAKTLAQALGDAGSGAAWKAQKRTGTGALSEENDVRRTALEALVQAYVPYGGDARTMIEDAILVVDHDDTLAIIEQAKKTASADAVTALQTLQARFETSPLRRYNH